MNMTSETWKILADAVTEMPNCPAWLLQQARLSWDAVSQLPAVDITIKSQHAAPTVEKKAVTPDYLSFLREQIKLSPRGAAWSAVLRDRLTALEPFVGRELVVANFFCKPYSATVRINPETNAIVHAEIN